MAYRPHSRTTECVWTSCAVCHYEFILQAAHHTYCKEYGDKAPFWCPNGHELVFKESEVQRLQREVAMARGSAARAARREQFTKRQLAATKGAATKLRKRIANGVCPCCHRSFSNLQRHMKTQHPTFEQEAP